MSTGPTVVLGRSCDNCTMCCKLPEIPELAKPKQQWCSNCDIGKGCKIYAERPETCREFYCHYLLDKNLDEHWKPSRSRMIVTFNRRKSWLRIDVDPARPNAWRGEPYYSDLKRWARNAQRVNEHVVVVVGDTGTLVLPDGEKRLDDASD